MTLTHQEPRYTPLMFSVGVRAQSTKRANLNDLVRYAFVPGHAQGALPDLQHFGSSVPLPFLGRQGDQVLFKAQRAPMTVEDLQRFPEMDVRSAQPDGARVSVDDWVDGIARYHEYLAAVDAERLAITVRDAGAARPAHFVVFERFTERGERLERTLLSVHRTRLAARYTLALLRDWRDWMRVVRNSRQVSYTDASVIFRQRVAERWSGDSVTDTLEVERPYATRGPQVFRQVERWALQRCPPVRVLDAEPKVEVMDHDRVEYLPGDPRLLRDGGQFGSYPLFEGDDWE